VACPSRCWLLRCTAQGVTGVWEPHSAPDVGLLQMLGSAGQSTEVQTPAVVLVTLWLGASLGGLCASLGERGRERSAHADSRTGGKCGWLIPRPAYSGLMWGLLMPDVFPLLQLPGWVAPPKKGHGKALGCWADRDPSLVRHGPGLALRWRA
jgi:hypothetical protein